MAGILVYLPGECQPPEIEFPLRGLASLLDRAVDAIPTPCPKGPDGGAGVLVTFVSMVSTDTPREYNADSQEWLCAPPDSEREAGRYWLGYVKAAKPSAGDLQRALTTEGEPVRLADGQEWSIPLAPYVPHRFTRDRATGVEMRVPADGYQEFVDWANKLYQLFLSDGFQRSLAQDRRMVIPGGFRFAAMALSLNYRVNLDAIDLLGLVQDWEAAEIARAATGLTTLGRLSAQKKSTVGAQY